MPNQTKNCL